jgi:hypothetical protein
LSTTNPTWTDQAPKPGLCGDRPATNCLRHGTTLVNTYTMCSRNPYTCFDKSLSSSGGCEVLVHLCYVPPEDDKDLSKRVGVSNTRCICIYNVHLFVLLWLQDARSK